MFIYYYIATMGEQVIRVCFTSTVSAKQTQWSCRCVITVKRRRDDCSYYFGPNLPDIWYIAKWISFWFTSSCYKRQDGWQYNTKTPKGWTEIDELLLLKGTFFVLDASTLWSTILAEAHDRVHGVQKTLDRLRASFCNPHIMAQVKELCSAAPSNNDTNQNTYIMLAYCNPFPFNLKYRVI